MSEKPLKPCAICGGECEGKARIKDAKGRYMHRTCAEAKKATGGSLSDGAKKRANPYQAAPAGGVMDMLVDDAIASAPAPCSNCGRPFPKDAVLCVHCGFNAATGKASRTRIEKPKKDKSEGGRRRPRFAIGVSPTAAAGLGIVVFGGLLALTFVSEAFVIPLFALYILFALGTYILSIVSAFQDGEVGWGITQIIAPFICFGGLLNLYYVFFVSGRENLKAMWVVTLIAGIGLNVFQANQALNALGMGVGAEGPSIFEQLDEYVETEYANITPRERGDIILVNLSDVILIERVGRGEELSSWEEEALASGTEPADYPPDVLNEARARWAQMSEDEKEDVRYDAFYDYLPEEGSRPLEEDLGGVGTGFTPPSQGGAGWDEGAFADVMGNPDPTPGFAPTQTARDAARPGEDPESVERALWQAAHWRATSALGERDADLLLGSARTIEDYDADIIDHVREMFSTLTADERGVLFAWVSRGEQLDGLGRIQARFAR